MKKRSKKYNPTSKYNPVQQARRLDKLASDLELHRKLIDAISKSHDNHITHLANFARHDIKNTIQSIDSLLSTTPASEFSQAAIDSLATHLSVIRLTIDNFAKLVPYRTTGKFTLKGLMVAVELLARADMQKHDIDMIFDYSRDAEEEIELPFQSILQMMNNLIINSIKSLESVEKKKMYIWASFSGKFICIKIKDNGNFIAKENADKIFDYGFSTTGGSGIGLFHARYLCNEFQGEITVDLNNESDYNKIFSIKLPLILTKDGKDSSNN